MFPNLHRGLLIPDPYQPSMDAATLRKAMDSLKTNKTLNEIMASEYKSGFVVYITDGYRESCEQDWEWHVNNTPWTD